MKRCGISRSLESSDLYFEWRACDNRLCSLRVDVGVGFRLIASEIDIRRVVEKNLVNIDGFASVWFVRFDFQGPRDFVGDSYIKQLGVAFQIETYFAVFVSQTRYCDTGGTFVQLRVEGFRDDFEGDHFSTPDFDFAYHVWLALPLVSCDNTRVLFPAWPDLELVDDDVPTIDALAHEWLI